MNRSDLIKKASRSSDLTPQQIEEMLDLLLMTIETTLSCGENVVIKNFGRFEIRDRAPTVRRNPKSGIDIKVPRKRGVLFKPAPALKAKVQCEEIEYERSIGEPRPATFGQEPS